MTLRLHNTMSRRVEEVVPVEPGHVRYYTCGPTVWNRAHIGNFRTFLVEDVLRRVLERRFARVTHVMNLTDVDDRIVANATAHGHGLEEETAPWIGAFFEDRDLLGILPAHHYPRATEYIGPMVDLVERLEAREVTYRSDGSVYFHIAAFPRYGRLSGTEARDLRAGASGRVDSDDYGKEDARDFALWKAAPPGGIGWDTRLGRGRPGWHLECSAMSMLLLGETFDIHAGGVDLVFPHHENEIAQSEAATGRTFARHWVHAEHLRIEDEKMSKRLGNFLTVPEVLADRRAGAAALRLLLVASAHYRKRLNFTSAALHAAGEQVAAIAAFRDRLVAARPAARGGDAVAAAQRTARAVDAALDEDLNVPEAVGALFVGMREANRLLDAGPLTAASVQALTALVTDADAVLGILDLVDRDRLGALDGADRDLLERRERARREGDYATSDTLRARLRERGVIVEDTPQGQRWRPAAQPVP